MAVRHILPFPSLRQSGASTPTLSPRAMSVRKCAPSKSIAAPLICVRTSLGECVAQSGHGKHPPTRRDKTAVGSTTGAGMKHLYTVESHAFSTPVITSPLELDAGYPREA
jgi:hypothetical protein